MARGNLRVIVKNTEGTVFEGVVDRVSSYNEIGTFDILPMHANFISMVGKTLALFKDRQKIKEFEVEQAILKVKQDTVHIFLGVELFAMTDEAAAGSEAQPNQQLKGQELVAEWKKVNDQKDKLKMLQISANAQASPGGD